MTSRLSTLFALVLTLFALVAGPAAAQQAQQVNPTALSVQEQQLLQALNPNSPLLSGRVSIPDQRAEVLIQPAGRDWRAFHQSTLPRITAVAILGTILVLGIFYAVRGRIRIDAGRSDQTITRFGGLDRFAHWLTAACFIVLALSGLNISVGRFVLLPVIGPDAFTALSQTGKYLHNYLAWPFMLGVVLMFLLWVKDNLPSALDITWLKQGGGLFAKGVHPPAERFNAGQKLIFWSVVAGGVALSVSGIIMLFPPDGGAAVSQLQMWTTIHALVGVVLIAVIIGHIYIGSIGMEGAFDAMGSGEVDLAWAREHHKLWVERELARERGAPRGAVPAE
jgi:formate dehydrogenase subunit gamma